MAARLVTDVVHGQQRRARQLELSARFKADGGGEALIVLALEGDDVFAFVHGRPAKAGQAVQHGLDAVVAFIGGTAQGRAVEAELFVLCAHAPLVARLFATADGFDQLIAGERRVVSHE